VKAIVLGEHQGDGIRYSMHLSAPAGGAAQMLRDPAGNWVPYADYAALKAETVKLLEETIPPVEAYIIKLEAENERLRKAGDELARVNDCRTGRAAFDIYIDEGKVEAIKAWLAAKGVQP